MKSRSVLKAQRFPLSVTPLVALLWAGCSGDLGGASKDGDWLLVHPTDTSHPTHSSSGSTPETAPSHTSSETTSPPAGGSTAPEPSGSTAVTEAGGGATSPPVASGDFSDGSSGGSGPGTSQSTSTGGSGNTTTHNPADTSTSGQAHSDSSSEHTTTGPTNPSTDTSATSDTTTTDTSTGNSTATGTSSTTTTDTSTTSDTTAPPDDPQCTDIPPDDREPCSNWALWGECDNAWIKDDGYCQRSCGRCTDGSAPEPPPDNSQPTSKFVGNITTNGALRQDFLQYWDQLTAENEGKWDAIEPQRDVMNWTKSDEYAAFCRENGIPYKQHTFVWGSQEPRWISDLPAHEQAAEVEEYMRLFCQRYPDVAMIDVVNEPDHATPSYAAALGNGLNDHGWVIWSFERARQHCPQAILILNDYNVLRWDTDNFVSIAKKLHSRGLLDAIGAQAHGLEDQSFDELKANFEKVAAVGVPVYISEYDVNEADDQRQLQIMQEQFTFFYNEPRVAGITLWGYVYGATWRTNTGLLRNGQPRPAFTWLMNFLGRQ